MDEIVNSAGKLRFLSGGQFSFPMVVLAHTGAGWGVGGQHNHNVEAWFAHSPGVKVVMPSTPADAGDCCARRSATTTRCCSSRTWPWSSHRERAAMEQSKSARPRCAGPAATSA